MELKSSLQIIIEGKKDMAPFRLDINFNQQISYVKGLKVYGIFDREREEFECRSFHFVSSLEEEFLFQVPSSNNFSLVDCDYSVALRAMEGMENFWHNPMKSFRSHYPDESLLGVVGSWQDLVEWLYSGTIESRSTPQQVAEVLAYLREPLDLKENLGLQYPQWLKPTFKSPPDVTIHYRPLTDEERDYATQSRVPLSSEEVLEARADALKTLIELRCQLTEVPRLPPTRNRMAMAGPKTLQRASRAR